MKKFFFFLSLLSVLGARAQNEVLMTINGEKITKSEFEYIYNKNNSDNAIDKKTLDEYLELFTIFKFKVAEARALGLDTTQAYISELAGYRNQLANNFLTDKVLEEKLRNEARSRLQEVVNVSHILLRLPENPAPADTLGVFQRALEIRKRLEKEDFETVAREVSEDPSAQQNGGTLGNISAFMMVYPFENAAFNTPVGKISQPVRTRFGYHIVRVNSRQANPGEVLIAHISLNAPRNLPADSLKAQEQRINNISKRIKAGESFESLVSLSDDKSTPDGKLPWFGVGRILPEIERTAFSLKVGEVSAPVQSPMGFHIIKLFDKRPFTMSDADFERQFSNSDRAALPVYSFVANLRKEYSGNEAIASLDDLALFDYASEQLENRNPEFRNLMQEYRDGILLFEISNQKVWEMAGKDTLGLQAFYDANKEKYRWEQPHFKGKIIYAPDEETAETVREIIRNAPKDSIDARLKANRDIISKIRIQRGLFAQGDNAAVDKLVFKTGDFEPDAKYPIVFVAEGSELLRQPQELADVRGQVTSDYQNFLEENWVRELKNKYRVEVFQDVLKKIKRN